MISLLLAATATPSGDLPLWVAGLGVVLAGGTIAAVFQYFSKRDELRANSEVTAATAEVTAATADEVSIRALTTTIETLSTENGRLTGRLTDFNVIFDRMELALGTKLDAARDQLVGLETKLDASQTLVAELKSLLEERPTKEDLQLQVGRLVEQLAGLGATPTNGPVKQ